MIERGASKPSVDVLRSLTLALGMQVSDFLEVVEQFCSRK